MPPMIGQDYDLGAPWPGLLIHHRADCPARDGFPCTCGPLGYRATIRSSEQEMPVVGPVLPTVEQAQAWKAEQEVAMDAFTAAAPRADTVAEVIDDFIDDARNGRALDAEGQPYESDSLRDLRWSLRGYVGSELGSMRLGQLRGADLRAFIGRLDAAGLSQARTKSVAAALRALLRYAADNGIVARSAADPLLFGDTDELPHATRAMTTSDLPQIPRTPPPMPMQTGPNYIHPPWPDPSHMTLAPPRPAAQQGTVPDEVIWLVLKIVAIVFALIALVLVAESV
jgi:hypothetical protein